MKILYKTPGMPPITKTVPNTLRSLQELVGGPIELITLDDDIAIIVHEEGKLRGLPSNFYVEELHDIIVGSAVFTRFDEEDLSSITDDDVARIRNKFGWRC